MELRLHLEHGWTVFRLEHPALLHDAPQFMTHRRRLTKFTVTTLNDSHDTVTIMIIPIRLFATKHLVDNACPTIYIGFRAYGSVEQLLRWLIAPRSRYEVVSAVHMFTHEHVVTGIGNASRIVIADQNIVLDGLSETATLGV